MEIRTSNGYVAVSIMIVDTKGQVSCLKSFSTNSMSYIGGEVEKASMLNGVIMAYWETF